MAQTIDDIRVAAETMLVAMTPDVETQWLFTRAPAHEPLSELPVSDAYAETMRQLRVVPGRIQGVTNLDTAWIEVVQLLEVQVRYPSLAESSEADARTLAMAAADEARIVQTLMRPNMVTVWAATPLITIEPRGSEYGQAVLRSGEESRAVSILRVSFAVTWRLYP